VSKDKINNCRIVDLCESESVSVPLTDVQLSRLEKKGLIKCTPQNRADDAANERSKKAEKRIIVHEIPLKKLNKQVLNRIKALRKNKKAKKK